MAQAKPEVNKSQAIRDFVAKNPNVPVPEVVTALAKSGVEVKNNLVYLVIGKMKAKKLKQKQEKATVKAATTATASSNGEAKAPSKSSAIRTVLKENRKMLASEVVSALAEKGITVTDSLVYFVKGKMKGQRGKKKQVIAQVATAMASTPASSDGDPLKTILKVKGWAVEVGGMKKLKALIEALLSE